MSDPFANVWWLLALRGLAGIGLAFVAVVWPLLTLESLLLGFGIYLAVDGAFAIYAGMIRHDHGYALWPLVVEGALGIVFAAVILAFPDPMALALWYLIAVWALATGGFEILAAVRLRRHYDGEPLLAGAGLASLLFGFIMVIWPRDAMIALSWLVGVYAAVFGVIMLVFAARLRRLVDARTHERQWAA
jgi:uncharacterized membrane protein HdeD (DUF308 family)